MTARWTRYPMGWLSPDGQAFCERGAPMSGGGTAWLVWVRLDDAEVEVSESVGERIAWPKYGSHTDPVRRLNELVDTDLARGPLSWFQHTNDAGSLAEAKDTAAHAVLDTLLRRSIRKTPGVTLAEPAGIARRTGRPVR